MCAGEDQGNILVFKKDNKLPSIINSTELGEYFKKLKFKHISRYTK